MAYTQKIKDYAKKLYLKVDRMGDQVESFRTIAKKVNQKETTKGTGKARNTPHTTILKWARENHWEAELQEIKNLFYRKVKEAEDREKEEAAADRKQALGFGALTMEHTRKLVDEDYDTFRQILLTKARFTNLWLNKDFGDYTKPEVKERMLSAWQEAIVFGQLSDAKLKLDELLAEASKFEDNELNITFEVIQTPAVITRPKEIEEAK